MKRSEYRWSAAQVAALRELWPTRMPIAKIAEIVGRSAKAVGYKGNALGLGRKGKATGLDRDQEQWLRRHYAGLRNEFCATVLGVSLSSVVRMARERGLKKAARSSRSSGPSPSLLRLPQG